VASLAEGGITTCAINIDLLHSMLYRLVPTTRPEAKPCLKQHATYLIQTCSNSNTPEQAATALWQCCDIDIHGALQHCPSFTLFKDLKLNTYFIQ